MITLTDRERKIIAHAMMTRNTAGTPEEFVAQHVAAVGEDKARARLDATLTTWGKNYDDVVAAETVIVLTDEERAILDHVLIVQTPEHWVARNVAEHGKDQAREWLDAKVKRHEQGYKDALAKDGANYKNAKQLHAEERVRTAAELTERVEQLKRDRQAEADAIEQRITAKIRAELNLAPPARRV